MREQSCRVVVDLIGLHDHTDLAPGVHGVDLVDTVVAGGDRLQLAQPFDVLLERLTAGARASAREAVDDLNYHRLDGLRLHLVVVGLHGVSHALVLLVAPRHLPADQRMRPLGLVRDRLADVVQQRRPGGRFVQNLKRLGIEATNRTVDTAQYQNRIDDFDFDMVVNSWGESQSPGNEQRDFWGSQAAGTRGL